MFLQKLFVIFLFFFFFIYFFIFFSNRVLRMGLDLIAPFPDHYLFFDLYIYNQSFEDGTLFGPDSKIMFLIL